MEWFRSWHGAPMDPKWLLIAKFSEVPAGVVSAIAWALFDHASQNSPRGDVANFDVETYSVFSEFGEMQVRSVISAMYDKKFIENGVLKGWAKRQPQREDGSAERSKAYRERNRTQKNANDHRTEKNRTEKITPLPPKGESAEFELFWKEWKSFEMTKGNKQMAAKSYEKAIMSGGSHDGLRAAAKKYCTVSQAQRCKTQHVTTWLNQRGWETPDEPVTSGGYDLYKMPSPAGG